MTWSILIRTDVLKPWTRISISTSRDLPRHSLLLTELGETREDNDQDCDSQSIVAQIWLEWRSVRKGASINGLISRATVPADCGDQDPRPADHSTQGRHVCDWQHQLRPKIWILTVAKHLSCALVAACSEVTQQTECGTNDDADPWKTVPLSGLGQVLADKAGSVTSQGETVERSRGYKEIGVAGRPCRGEQNSIDNRRQSRYPGVFDGNDERRFGRRGVQVE